MSEQIRYINKPLTYTAAECDTPQTLHTTSEISRLSGWLLRSQTGGLCSNPSPQGRAWQVLPACSHPKGSSTHLNGSVSAELVHAQEGQADTLRDTSSSHCCCSLQDTEQATLKICLSLLWDWRDLFCIRYFYPLHCHNPFRQLSPTHTSSMLLKIQYQDKKHCSCSKI